MSIFRKKQTAFGLDISDNSVKAAQFKRKSGNKLRLSSIGRMNVPTGVLEDGSVLSQEQLKTAIKDLLANTRPRKIRAKKVICSLPETKVFLHLMEFPSIDSEKLYEAVKWEMEQYIPIAIDQVYLDWEVISQNENRLEILAAAAPKLIVDTYSKILGSMGMDVIAFDLKSRALSRTLISHDAEIPCTLIVDIGSEITTFSVYDQGIIRYSESIPSGGDAFTRMISNKLNVQTKEAVLLKRGVGLDQSKHGGEVYYALEEPINDIITEVKKTIEFYQTQKATNAKVSRVIVVGGSAQMPGLVSYLQENIGLQVELGNVNATHSFKIDRRTLKRYENRILSFATTFGLGIRGILPDPVTKEINLIPQSIQQVYEKRGIKSFIKFIYNSVLVFSVLVSMTYGGAWGYFYYESIQLDKQIIETQENRDKESKDLEDFTKKFNTAISVLSRIQHEKEDWGKVIAMIITTAPKTALITDISTTDMNERKINVSGTAESRNDVISHKEKLEDSGLFEEVKNPLSNLSGDEEDNIKYTIELKVKVESLRSEL